jgi:hypothetical protein
VAFLSNSRYASTETFETTDSAGRTVTCVRLRTLGSPEATAQRLAPRESLDQIAYSGYGDSTRFWHVADANTALHSRDLLVKRAEDRPIIINVPSNA